MKKDIKITDAEIEEYIRKHRGTLILINELLIKQPNQYSLNKSPQYLLVYK